MFRARPLLILLCLFAGGVLGWRLHHLHLSAPPAPASSAQPAPPVSAEPKPLLESPPLPLTQGWVQAAPGADYWVREAAGGLARIAVVRVDLSRYRLEVADLTQGQPKSAAVKSLAEQRGAVAAINGGYFDENWQPLGLLVHAGKQTSPLRAADWGIFYVAHGRPGLRHTRQGLPAGATEALQCGPRLVIAGRLPSFKPGESSRAAVGITASGQVVLAVTCRGALSLHDWARAMKALGCRDALNLDGGPSSQLYFHVGKTTLDLPGAYGVPSALLVMAR